MKFKEMYFHAVVIAVCGSFLTSVAQAETTNANIQDHYKTVIEQQPYRVEVCKDVQTPVYGNVGSGASAGDVLGGMIIGGLIGKGVTNKDNGAAAGAVIGGMIAADKNQNKQGITGYRTERQCSVETRYEETQREVYSHSTVTFYADGSKRTLKFNR